jgi:hypothetical protein
VPAASSQRESIALRAVVIPRVRPLVFSVTSVLFDLCAMLSDFPNFSSKKTVRAVAGQLSVSVASSQEKSIALRAVVHPQCQTSRLLRDLRPL